jgi:3-oxoadipate enol-lactonase
MIEKGDSSPTEEGRARIGASDLALHYAVSGEGAPLVLTHGLGDDLHFWDGVVASLGRHHRVVRWDVRGFGHSDKPAGPYSPAMLAADLAGLLDALALDRVHLAGISMGGVISQRFALDFPDRVRSLVLVSTSSEVGERARARWERLAERVEQSGFDRRTADATRAFSAGYADLHPEVVNAATEQTLSNDPAAYAAAARAMSAYAWTEDLTRVGSPTLILQGLEDRLTPPGGSVRMSRALPYARLLLVPGAGHNLPLERPDLFCFTLLAFTAGVDLGTLPPVAGAGGV